MNDFLERIMELGSCADRACSESERKYASLKPSVNMKNTLKQQVFRNMHIQ